MRHIELTPMAIVEVGLGHHNGVAKVKAPVLIETLSFTSLHCRNTAQEAKQKYESLHNLNFSDHYLLFTTTNTNGLARIIDESALGVVEVQRFGIILRDEHDVELTVLQHARELTLACRE